jgi:DNA-binding CsgD family transcriptional regulator/tetratricopeptide (TPR) repeat protein
MGDVTPILDAARDAYARRDWQGARDGLRAARDAGELSADDLHIWADAAWWLGLVDESLAASEEAYRMFLQGARPRQAASAATTIAVSLFLRGDDVAGSGWMSRAQRILRDQPECPEHGYVRYLLEVEAALGGGDLNAVTSSAREVQEIGRRQDDPNLVALGTLGEGRALIRQGRVADGSELLDEAMVAVLGDELSPEWAGNIYCHLMAACHELADFRRAAEWTRRTTRWLETLPTAVLFTGICRVHRSQVFQTTGAWEQAESEAVRVCEELAEIHVASVAEAHYQLGELRRLRGDLVGAERAYTDAHERGRDPQPGLALLRLAQGRIDAAAASIRAGLAGTSDRLARAWLCVAHVEIACAAGDVETAGKASAELNETASDYGSSGLDVMARHARGAVLLADGQVAKALETLRGACELWQELYAPYECARVRLLLARAYNALGDSDAAARELDAAEAVFTHLGATLDARNLVALRGGPPLAAGLTRREAEVLALVAAGKTNHEVATALSISRKTVARHLSNIFTKIEVSSRTEAAAYAFAHDLASPARG